MNTSNCPAPLFGEITGTGFTVLRQIGEGATSRCYLAQERNASRLVVLKEFCPARYAPFLERNADAVLKLRPKYAYLQPDLDRMFEYFCKEKDQHLLLRKKLNQANLSNLGSVFDCRSVPGRHDLLVLDTEAGCTLRDLIEHRPEKLRDESQYIIFCLHVAAELAKALGALHHLGILYLDINPGNVFLSSANPFEELHYRSTFSVTMLDMASAYEKKHFQRECFSAGEYLVSSGSTPGYTAPILADARRASATGRMESFWKVYQDHPLDERLDYYSVAALICRMLLDHTPPVASPDFTRVTFPRRSLLADHSLRNRLTSVINKALMIGSEETGREYSEREIRGGAFQKDLDSLAELAALALSPQTAAQEAYDKALAHLRKQASSPVNPLLLSPAAAHRRGCKAPATFPSLTEALETITGGYSEQTGVRLIGPVGSGKTTQLLRTGLTLMTQGSASCPDSQFVFFYLHADQIPQRTDGDLLSAVLQHPAFAFRASQRENGVAVIRDTIVGATGEAFLSHRYILTIDGLDEVQEKKKLWICSGVRRLAGYSNLIVITVSSTDEAGLFVNPSVKITLTGLDTQSAALRKQLIQWGISDSRQSNAFRTPMLLLLAARQQNALEAFQHETLQNCQLIQQDPRCGVSSGEIIWNYVQSQIISRKLNGDASFATKLLLHALPRVIFHELFLPQKVSLEQFRFNNLVSSALGLRNPDSSKLNAAIRLLQSLDLIRTEESRIRIHPLYRDFFGLLYAANTISGIYSFTRALKSEEKQVLQEPLVFDVTNQHDLLIGILPGILHCNGSQYFKENTLQALADSCSAPQTTSISAYQRFYRAVYALHCARFVCSLSNVPANLADQLSNASFDCFQELAESLISKPGLLAPTCETYVFFILAKSYRIADFFGQTRYRPHINRLAAPDLRESLRFGFAAWHVSERSHSLNLAHDPRIADACCYIGKTYLAAQETIINRLLDSAPEAMYRLNEKDLILLPEDFDHPNLAIDASELQRLLEQRMGDLLNRETALTRAKRLRQIALWWLHKAENNGSVLSMNLLGLMALTEQESLHAEQRDYRPVYQMFAHAAGIPHPYGTYYAAAKAAKLLAEGRVAIQANGQLCKATDGDREKTAQTTEEWIRYALSSSDQEGKCAYYQGLLYLSRGDQASLRKAVGHFIHALSLGSKVPTCLALCETALSLNSEDTAPLIHAAVDLIVTGTARLGEQLLTGESLKDDARSVLGPYYSDRWKPSLFLLQEICAQARGIVERHQAEIRRLRLQTDAERLLNCVDEQMSFLKESACRLLKY